MNTTGRSNWMLYGAYGMTGRLIVDEAVRRGHRPILAGRDGEKLAALGRATGLPTMQLSLDDGPALRAALARVSCVLLAAGPFDVTGPLMRAACIDARCSYLDVSGEIDDFAAALASDGAARAAGIGIIPGAGYGVVFGESLAAQVARRLPDAMWLRLSLATKTDGSSRGALLSTATAISTGSREVRNGSMRTRPLAFSTWQGPSSDGASLRFAVAPLAEVRAAHASTGIPNIVGGIPLSRVAAAAVRIGGPVLGKALAWYAARSPRTTIDATTEQPVTRTLVRSRVWVEAGNAAGERVVAMLETGEGYRAAAAAAVRGLELQLQTPRIGALTPAQAFGPEFALLVPGTRVVGLERRVTTVGRPALASAR